MVQTTKAYKYSWKQTLKAYKSNMGTNHKILNVNLNNIKLKVLKVSPLQNDEKL